MEVVISEEFFFFFFVFVYEKEREREKKREGKVLRNRGEA